MYETMLADGVRLPAELHKNINASVYIELENLFQKLLN